MELRELTKDEVAIFVTLELSSNADELFEQLKTVDSGWVLKAIEKRFTVYKISVDKKIMIAVLSIGDGVVGKCAKYVDDIASWSHKFNRSKIEWYNFVNEIYPTGVPNF